MRSLLLLGSVLIVACAPASNDITLTLKDEELARCTTARVENLHDGDLQAGFRIVCKEPNWFLFVNEDTRNRKDMTIDELEFKRWEVIPSEPSVHIDMLAAVESGDCPSAQALNRTTGEARIPRWSNLAGQSGALKAGRYTLELSTPCGALVIDAKENE